MVEGVRDQAIKRGLVDKESWDKGIRDLYRTTEQDGTFCYTFFKAVGRKEGENLAVFAFRLPRSKTAA
jgi:hypothetical protein